MRFFIPIFAASAAAISVTGSSPDPCAAHGCFTMTSLDFYAPSKGKPDDNLSINFNIYASEEVGDTCVFDWKYGKSAGKAGYPTKDGAVTCAGGVFAFYFKSFTSITDFTIVAKYTYGTGSAVETKYGEAVVTEDDLSCKDYLNAIACELGGEYYTDGLPLEVFLTEP